AHFDCDVYGRRVYGFADTYDILKIFFRICCYGFIDKVISFMKVYYPVQCENSPSIKIISLTNKKPTFIILLQKIGMKNKNLRICLVIRLIGNFYYIFILYCLQ